MIRPRNPLHVRVYALMFLAWLLLCGLYLLVRAVIR